MSDNYRFYAQKMEELRAHRTNTPLRAQLQELLAVVRECEARWAAEDRIERAR